MSRQIIECDSCGQTGELRGHGWCGPCWKRWDYAGRPDTGPPPRRIGRWEEYLELTREQHYTPANAAARMGICQRTAERHEARLRAMGIPPAIYQSGRLNGTAADTLGQKVA